MIYELRCRGGSSGSPMFSGEATQFLLALHPAFREFDTNPLDELVDELSLEANAAQVQVVFEGESLPLTVTMSSGLALFSVNMGVFGDEARERLAAVLDFAFAFAARFSQEVFDTQLNRLITKDERDVVLVQVAAKFEQMLDF
jgi:hypothetical protein